MQDHADTHDLADTGADFGTQTATADEDAARSTAVDPGAQSIESRVEAVLITAGRPVAPDRLVSVLGFEDQQDGRSRVADAVDALNQSYETTGRAFRIVEVSGGYRIATRPEYIGVIGAFHSLSTSTRLSRAAVETLAIVAYRQPVTRAEVDAIRGVASGEVLRSLIDRSLVSIAGRAEEVGRPLLYGTSKRFLETFGLRSIKDLPDPAQSLSGEDG